ncbi:MAG: NHLP family bacteriocin export ABC transporter peptidase/permease/ATPase subunit [Lachnospira sp.]
MNKKKYKKQPITKGRAKVPVIMQMEALECGAACLTMVAAYYGLWIPLEQVRKDCGVSHDGSNAKNILKAARNYGFTAKGYRYEPARLKEKGKFPCIIHWNFNHFVVLDGFKGNKVYINDPARGDVCISMEEFDESFTGICLMIEPSENFTPGGAPKSIMSFAKERLKGTGAAFAMIIITTLISSLISIINPAFSRMFIDRLLTGQNPDWFYPFIIALVAAAVIQIAVCWIKASYLLKVQGKFAVVADSSFMWHILRLPLEFFSQRMAGDIAGRQRINQGIASTFINTLAPMVLDTATLIFYLVVMLRYSPLLTAIGLVSMFINFFVSYYISKKRINVKRVQMRDSAKLCSATLSGIEMIETIKASGAENGFFQKWAGYQASVNNGEVKFKEIDYHIGIIPSLVSSLCNIVILGMGVFLTMQGEFTVGMILAFQGFMTSFSAPAQNLMNAGQTIQEMRTNMERVEDIMKYPTDVEYGSEDISDDVSYDKLTGNVELKNVTFGYSRLAEPLIKDFSLKLDAGKSVALVGGSGSGKSTISKLISGLYEPWDGEILFDGKPLKSISHEVFTGSLAVVDQDIILFEDTIANNIKMWDNSIEDFEMIMAARDAQIHDVIMERDNGYQYKMLEGGVDFSGGQRQRLEIARVLAQDPTIVILDEATSALDARTEYNVVRSIKDRGITMIVVAHRLSTIRDCDEIIVLDKGQVVERGTHDELIKLGGKYTELVTSG